MTMNQGSPKKTSLIISLRGIPHRVYPEMYLDSDWGQEIGVLDIKDWPWSDGISGYKPFICFTRETECRPALKLILLTPARCVSV